MPRWIRAEKLPKHCEGNMAWRYDEYIAIARDPYLYTVPVGYSRDPHHCGGVWFMPIRFPTKPPVKPTPIGP